MPTPSVERRWLHLTPDRFLFGLLALEGFLLLSEWRCWFAFNEHKGWTVLIAVASVGVALLLLTLWLVVSVLLRRRFQLGIRSLLAQVICVAIPCSWLAVRIQQARKQKEVVEAIVKEGGEVGGEVLYDYQVDASGRYIQGAQPPGPAWLRKLLGDDFFIHVIEVNVSKTRVRDANLEHFKGLTTLESLFLGRTQVTDAGLEQLKGLTQLKGLNLLGTQVTDAGLEHVARLFHLEHLSVGDTQVTDAGLERLKGLTQLKSLYLSDTQVTDAGLERLKGFKQLKVLYLSNTQVTDAGLEHLKGLTQLKGLVLTGTKVTDAGLQHLKGLTQLQVLYLRRTLVTDQGVKKLQETLPNCEIDH